MKKEIITIVVLSVVILSIFSYWGVGAFKQRDTNIFDKGVEAGKSIAVQFIFETAGQCQIVPLQFNNATINILAQHCLK